MLNEEDKEKIVDTYLNEYYPLPDHFNGFYYLSKKQLCELVAVTADHLVLDDDKY